MALELYQNVKVLISYTITRTTLTFIKSLVKDKVYFQCNDFLITFLFQVKV